MINDKCSGFGPPHPAIACKLLLEILLRQRILFVLTLPEDRHHPPAVSVVHQLNAIDPSLKRFRVAWCVARFVSTENVRNLAKRFQLPCSLLLIETLFFKERLRSGDVVIDAQSTRTITACLPWISWNQASTRYEQGSHAIPVALFSRRPGDHVVDCGNNRIN